MLFDWPTRMEKRKNLPLEMQEWYDSDAPGKVATALIQDLQLNPQQKGPLIGIVGDTTLGLVVLDSLPDYIHSQVGVPLPLAQVIAEHLVVLLTQAQVLPPPQKAAPLPQREMPLPQPDVSPTAPPVPPAWQQTRPTVPDAPQPPAAAPANLPVQTPPVIPQYQKPLTSVPPYRNANLYQKPPETPQ